jgi:quinol monooxygenase YgiN
MQMQSNYLKFFTKTLLLGCLVFGFSSTAVLAGERDTMGKVRLTFTIVTSNQLAAEGEALFKSHAAWMKETHHHTGPKALLSYDVSKMAELTDPTDLSSRPTGNTIFVLNEVYESEAGVQDHFQRTPSWKDWPSFDAWMKKSKTTKVASAKIIHSLTWGGK